MKGGGKSKDEMRGRKKRKEAGKQRKEMIGKWCCKGHERERGSDGERNNGKVRER